MRHPVCGRRVTTGLLVAAALGVWSGAGCSSKDGDRTGPTGTIALVLGPAAATVIQGESTPVAATLTRMGGFTGEVVLSVDGAPTGVTDVVSNIVTSGGTTTATVTINVNEAVVPVSYSLTVRARGTGVSDATATFTLTVSERPSYTLALAPVAIAIDRGSSDVIQVVIGRTNYTGAITLSLDGAPTSVTGIFAPAAPTGTNSTLSIAVDPAAGPGQYNLTVRGIGAPGSAANLVDRSAPLTLTVTVAPSRIAGGLWHTLAIKADGTLWAWGENIAGQLGDGTLTNSRRPVPTGAGARWRDVAAYGHTVALKSDGTMWAWGTNYIGQLGDGTTINRPTPIPIGLSATWRSIAAGIQHTLAVKSDGTLWAWGSNRFGQLGDGTTTDRLAPTQIGTGRTWHVVAAGDMFTLALKSDGTLWAWGDNRNGQLGDGTIMSRETPTPIAGGATWTAIAAGTAFTLALKSDGTLWAWGYNGFGQLGDGLTTDRLTPTPMGTGTTWSTIAAGAFHSVALKSDGTLWTWGKNDFGQLGDGFMNSFRPTPIQIGAGTTWSAVGGGWGHSIARKLDGTFWTWGFNGFGQLGDGTTTSRAIPTPIEF